ncbi:fluoride efflux transporter FluC [Agrococcus casei]|uniref:Fluoride-specific ion channel FluC n=1 Tax=Agrococcus casei LMG 22410 TaxID=1255656 RepID=A0A1R4G8H6_9MICO|nr:CrcB family protein [Agrococcus casei]SJM64375.1 CrcB protein [Agrococcus casei LMG 22410]
MTPASVLLVALGGAVGALLRFGLSRLGSERTRPWITVGVNIAGSLIAGLAASAIDDPGIRLAVLTGFCGGFTTFSTASTDAAKALRRRERVRAVALVAVTALVSVAFAWLGITAGQVLWS